MSSVEPLERVEAERRYVTYATLGRRRRRGRRAVQAAGVFVSVVVIAAALIWSAMGLSGLRRQPATPPLTTSSISLTHTGGCRVTDVGGAECWGVNADGQLGDGSHRQSRDPVAVEGLGSGVVSVAAGSFHACAVTDRGVLCWGGNSQGQLGVGDRHGRSVPTLVVGLDSPVVSVHPGFMHTCALTEAGGVWCWGTSWESGAEPSKHPWTLTPAVVPGLASGVVQVAVGDQHTCALLDTGVVRCWGRNVEGDLGSGNRLGLQPREVRGLPAPAVAIAAGNGHTCALLATDRVWCWGTGTDGTLGDGGTGSSADPVEVVGLSDIVAISAGSEFTCALLASGEVRCWGRNYVGQLGNGSYARTLLPTTVMGLPPDVVGISAGGASACATAASGGVYCWGTNRYGQLTVRTGAHLQTAEFIPALSTEG